MALIAMAIDRTPNGPTIHPEGPAARSISTAKQVKSRPRNTESARICCGSRPGGFPLNAMLPDGAPPVVTQYRPMVILAAKQSRKALRRSSTDQISS
ncbi:MAG: hypothetical protein AAFY03_01385, partial [Pseudomonadota bacterium]